MLHIDRTRRLVVVINSAAEQPTDRAARQVRRDFIAAVQAEVDAPAIPLSARQRD